MIENFRFNDLVLYCKHWYKHSDNILDDLGYIFSQIYAWTPKTEEEVAHFMLRAVDVLYDELGIKFDSERNGHYNNSFASFQAEIKNRMRLYQVSYDMACIYWAINVFSQLSRNEIKLNPPVYGKKEHFRMGGLFSEHPISMTYTEMNRIAIKAFSK